MKKPPENQKSNALQTIFVAVVIAILAGGTSPWWWSKMFPDPQPSSVAVTGPAPEQGPAATQQETEPQVKRPYMGPLEGGTSRHGYDLSSVGIQTNSAADCAGMCATDDNCKAMTFVKHADANGGICWLKGSVPSPSPNQAMVSAIKVYPPQ